MFSRNGAAIRWSHSYVTGGQGFTASTSPPGRAGSGEHASRGGSPRIALSRPADLIDPPFFSSTAEECPQDCAGRRWPQARLNTKSCGCGRQGRGGGNRASRRNCMSAPQRFLDRNIAQTNGHFSTSQEQYEFSLINACPSLAIFPMSAFSRPKTNAVVQVRWS